ncbi:hatching enzyme 1.2-like [Clupea harengus]|uniref:Metalloendopeptidase n=1 Tax=Clupea harengus TaxID=7950 RepID=A0A6P3VGV7_CLUHA|nr:hatching enzyme 1.2-like [Clupea harengus]
MSAWKISLGLLAVLLVSSTRAEDPEDVELSVSEIIEKANKNVVRGPGEPFVIDDIAYGSEEEYERNADPCTTTGCMWEKSGDGNVYVPYKIHEHYSDREESVILRGLKSIESVSCIRFIPRTHQRGWIHILSLNGCYSHVGRRGQEQSLSLNRQGCVYHHTVQHELLHALGFNHEQTRSDRDNHIKILYENIQPMMTYNFDKIETLNQGTPYDYDSVMHYHRTAFSKNKEPTMVPIPDPDVEIGKAREMSQNDILRLNRLYNCVKKGDSP